MNMIGLLALVAGLSAQCPAENAHYILRHSPAVSAFFRPVNGGSDWPSRLALEVRNVSTGHTSWWLPWLGGTDNLQNIASTTDVAAPNWQPPNPDNSVRPEGDRQYVGLDGDYNIIDGLPHRGAAAPVHFLISNGGSSHDQTFPTKQMFDLIRCSESRKSER